MLSNQAAIKIMEHAVQNGAPLVTAAHADLPSIKALLEQCLYEDLPAVLGPCAKGG